MSTPMRQQYLRNQAPVSRHDPLFPPGRLLRDLRRGRPARLAGLRHRAHLAPGRQRRSACRWPASPTTPSTPISPGSSPPGYKVAICEQIGDTPVKGLVPREVGARRHARHGAWSRRCSTTGATTTWPPSCSRASAPASPTPTSPPASSPATQIEDRRSGAAPWREELERLQAGGAAASRRTGRRCLAALPRSRRLDCAPYRYDAWRFELEDARQRSARPFRRRHAGRLWLRRTCRWRSAPPAPWCSIWRETQQARAGPAHRPAHLRHSSEFMVLDAATRRNLELTRDDPRAHRRRLAARRARQTDDAHGQAPAARLD